MSWCVLDEEQFHQCCWLFLQQSEQLRDGWSWEAVQGSTEGYLRKTALRSVPADWITTQKHQSHSSLKSQGEEKLVASVDPDFLIEDEDDGICTVCEGSSLVLQYEYHILYSCSYSTPVLYFRASTLGGKSLTLEEVWGSVHPQFRLHLHNCPLNAITQQEHPLLGQPFFFLHPCRTEEFMRPLLQMAQEQCRVAVSEFRFSEGANTHFGSWLSPAGGSGFVYVPQNRITFIIPQVRKCPITQLCDEGIYTK
ncbi:ubiquitin-like-conjugating enzyme ATG10 isoform 1-T4 [Odontesthes bonariensis]|uniref:ubiquitin-like-conjugating enzyme ATG10 isoform X1 n=1 Tax=Odontesthes bonariensis TaxID=219752 RepID=UPI003F582C68